MSQHRHLLLPEGCRLKDAISWVVIPRARERERERDSSWLIAQKWWKKRKRREKTSYPSDTTFRAWNWVDWGREDDGLKRLWHQHFYYSSFFSLSLSLSLSLSPHSSVFLLPSRDERQIERGAKRTYTQKKGSHVLKGWISQHVWERCFGEMKSRSLTQRSNEMWFVRTISLIFVLCFRREKALYLRKTCGLNPVTKCKTWLFRPRS